jgi:chromosome segregation ATPase
LLVVAYQGENTARELEKQRVVIQKNDIEIYDLKQKITKAVAQFKASEKKMEELTSKYYAQSGELQKLKKDLEKQYEEVNLERNRRMEGEDRKSRTDAPLRKAVQENPERASHAASTPNTDPDCEPTRNNEPLSPPYRLLPSSMSQSIRA